MDGCSVNKGGRGWGEGRSASPAMRTKYRRQFGEITELRGSVPLFVVCLVCWLGRFGASSVGRLVGTPLVDAWFVGCLVGYPPFLFYSPSFGWCVGWLGLLGLLFAWLVGQFVWIGGCAVNTGARGRGGRNSRSRDFQVSSWR